MRTMDSERPQAIGEPVEDLPEALRRRLQARGELPTVR
jgi:hypothetical protein